MRLYDTLLALSLTICLLLIPSYGSAQRMPSIDRSVFSISANSVSLSAKGGKRTLTVTSDHSWSIVKKSAMWVNVVPNGKSLTITAKPNTQSSPRTTSFVIGSSIGQRLTVTVKQQAAPKHQSTPSTSATQGQQTSRQRAQQYQSGHSLTVSPAFAHFDAAGGERMFYVQSSDEWTVVSNPPKWVHLSKSDQAVSLRVDANWSASSRVGSFTILSKYEKCTVDFTQSASAENFDISDRSVDFFGNGGSKEFYIKSDHPWRVSVDPYSWGHLTREGDKLTLTVDANPYAHKRTDYFRISSGNKSIKVDIRQEAATQLMVDGSTSHKEIKFDRLGIMKTFQIISPNGAWKIAVKPDWCTVTNRDGGRISISCNVNNGDARSGIILISCGKEKVSLSVWQEGR